jgi:DNA-binding transcriptional LysR family regulator
MHHGQLARRRSQPAAVFEAAYEERNLSRAARRLAMTQSAVSHALTRLRAVFRDDLFVRKTKGVEPTQVADLIYGRLRGALGAVRDAVRETRVFDPETSQRSFFIGISHPLGPLIAMRLRERLGVRPRMRRLPSARGHARSKWSAACAKAGSTPSSTGCRQDPDVTASSCFRGLDRCSRAQPATRHSGGR